ncbi:hypothetical protein PR003_g29878 [Phytophthora rubi]|uniref:Uncharacterized protein n=1 Tax=Phytophthora rubi TaxID=129364 RepID=A0A6A4BGS2_9STRA|nr:hypothetical protein PR003_g29878 [Phytophthora rubi]
MAPLIASPLEKLPGNLRAESAVNLDAAELIGLVPICSRPRPAVKARRLVATSTVSHSIVEASPPLTGSVVSLTTSPFTSDAVTLVPIQYLMPCFLSSLLNSLMDP